MRTIRSLRRDVPPGRAAAYLDALAAFGALLRERELVKGFYVMESVQTPGVYWEFLEYADGAAAERAAGTIASDERLRAAEANVTAAAGASPADDSMWTQRL